MLPVRAALALRTAVTRQRLRAHPAQADIARWLCRWDIFHENWGWMLCFWNLAGVPFMYSWQSVLILRNDISHPVAYTAACFALLLGSYYMWDTANSQKNRFRMQRNGGDITRSAFPQLRWGTLANPEVRFR